MGLGLFRKSLALHQWIADKVGMEIDLRRRGMVSCDACSYDTIIPRVRICTQSIRTL
jgi:hypothetical protein